jgi:NDP-sugar pyrophosphorylase family protein
MRPLTDALPKPLLPFLNTPILAYALDHLARAGCRQVALNLHHLGAQIPPVVDRLLGALAPAYGPIEAVYVHEPTLRGTAGGVAGLWDALGAPNTTLIVLNGDSVMDVDLAAHLAQHRQDRAQATLLARTPDGQHPGGLWADAQRRVTGLRHLRPQGPGHDELDFMGVHFLEPSVLRRATQAAQAASAPCMVGDVYIPSLGGDEAPWVQRCDKFWVALDTPALLLEATERVLRDPSIFPQSPFFDTHAPGLCLLQPSALDDQTRLAPPVFLGALAGAGPNAQLGPCVVADGTRFGAGTRARRSIFYGMGLVEGEWDSCVAVGGKVAQAEG